jgi:hypothetical protein
MTARPRARSLVALTAGVGTAVVALVLALRWIGKAMMAGVDALARELDLTTEDYFAERQAGRSVPELATERGIPMADLLRSTFGTADSRFLRFLAATQPPSTFDRLAQLVEARQPLDVPPRHPAGDAG